MIEFCQHLSWSRKQKTGKLLFPHFGIHFIPNCKQIVFFIENSQKLWEGSFGFLFVAIFQILKDIFILSFKFFLFFKISFHNFSIVLPNGRVIRIFFVVEMQIVPFVENEELSLDIPNPFKFGLSSFNTILTGGWEFFNSVFFLVPHFEHFLESSVLSFEWEHTLVEIIFRDNLFDPSGWVVEILDFPLSELHSNIINFGGKLTHILPFLALDDIICFYIHTIFTELESYIYLYPMFL